MPNLEIIRLIIGIYIAAIGSMGVFSNELINTLCIIAGYVILLFKTAKKATEDDYKYEFLDYIIAVKIVENIEREDEYEFTYSGEEKVEDVENTDSTHKKR